MLITPRSIMAKGFVRSLRSDAVGNKVSVQQDLGTLKTRFDQLIAVAGLDEVLKASLLAGYEKK